MLEQRSRDGAIGAFKAEVTEDRGAQQGRIIMSIDPAFPQPVAKDFLKKNAQPLKRGCREVDPRAGPI